MIANYVGKAWTAIMSLAFIPVYIHFLGIENYGLVGFYITIQSLLSFVEMGFGTTINRELSRLSVSPENVHGLWETTRTLEYVYFVLAILAIFILGSLAPFIADHWIRADHLERDDLVLVIVMMGLVIGVRLPFSLYSGGLQGMQQQVKLNVMIMTIALIRAGGTVLVLMWVSPSIIAFFVWQLVVELTQTIFGRVMLWRSLPAIDYWRTFSFVRLKNLARFSFSVGLVSATGTLLSQIDKLAVSNMLSIEMLGYYTFASAVAAGVLYFTYPITIATFPRLSALFAIGDGAALKHIYRKTNIFISTILFPIVFIIATFSEEILALWTGDISLAQKSANILALLVLGAGANGLYTMPYSLALAQGWTRILLYVNVIALVIFIPIVYLFIEHFGVIGSSFAWLILHLSYLLVPVRIIHARIFGQSGYHEYVYDVAPPALGAMIVVIAAKWWIPEIMSHMQLLLYLCLVLSGALIVGALTTQFGRMELKSTLKLMLYPIRKANF